MTMDPHRAVQKPSTWKPRSMLSAIAAGQQQHQRVDDEQHQAEGQHDQRQREQPDDRAHERGDHAEDRADDDQRQDLVGVGVAGQGDAVEEPDRRARGPGR